MKLSSQKDFVIRKLRQNGEITRNECLQNRITRLGAIIWTLRNEDKWEIAEGEFRKTENGKDFVYKLIAERPKSVYEKMHEEISSGKTNQATLNI